jgi:type I restriction enzyme S subunit
MTDWQIVKLGQICTFKYGQMPNKADLSPEGYPIFSGYRIVGYSNRYHYRNSEIVVVARGVGGTGDIKMSPPFCFLTNLSIVALIQSKDVYKKFLYYRLASTTLWSLRTGSAQAQITIERLTDYEVALPPLAIQHKVASILSTYDNLIENNLRRIKILEEMAKTIYDEWFVKFHFPGHEKVKMVESELGLIPEGWEFCRLANLANINALTIKQGEEPKDIFYVDISSVSVGLIENPQRMRFEEAPSRARRIVRHGDIIWSTVRPNRKSYGLILNPMPNLIISTGFAVISPIDCSFTYLYNALTAEEFVAYLTNRATGAAYPAVNQKDFEQARVLNPIKSVNDQFHQIVEPMFELRYELVQKNKILRKARDLLLPKLISGEIDVESLDIKTEE